VQQWQSMGAAVWRGIETNDWSSLGQSIARPIADLMSNAFAGSGPIGGILGGFLGAAVSGLIGKAFGGGRKARDGQTPQTAQYVYQVNTGDVATELLKAVQRGLLSSAGSRTDQITAQLRGGGNLAMQLRRVAI